MCIYCRAMQDSSIHEKKNCENVDNNYLHSVKIGPHEVFISVCGTLWLHIYLVCHLYFIALFIYMYVHVYVGVYYWVHCQPADHL